MKVDITEKEKDALIDFVECFTEMYSEAMEDADEEDKEGIDHLDSFYSKLCKLK